jgi:hypothetical protein
MNYLTKIEKYTKTFFHKIKKLSKAQCLKIKAIKNSIDKNIKSLISGLIIIFKPNSENLLKLKKSIQISYNKLKKLQKVGLFLYVIVSIYRGIFFMYSFTSLLPIFTSTTSSKRIHTDETTRF